jgi:hypothetical protein
MRLKTLAAAAAIMLASLGAVALPAEAQAQTRGGCNPAVVALINRDFPPSARSWAVGVAWRESRCIPTARNRSGASGIFQMMLPLHNAQFRAVGCSPASWRNAACNVAAAAHLFRQNGTRPWR